MEGVSPKLENALIGLFVAFVISIPVYFIPMLIGSFEASSKEYSRVELWMLETPSVTPLVGDLISDGELSFSEYLEIKEYVKDEPKRLVLKKVSEAQ
ncbi:TPA: hypothetical protein RTK63_001384 [Vibrio harveyi]|nr:hypothetical protein [Vibrio harveyi]